MALASAPSFNMCLGGFLVYLSPRDDAARTAFAGPCAAPGGWGGAAAAACMAAHGGHRTLRPWEPTRCHVPSSTASSSLVAIGEHIAGAGAAAASVGAGVCVTKQGWDAVAMARATVPGVCFLRHAEAGCRRPQ